MACEALYSVLLVQGFFYAIKHSPLFSKCRADIPIDPLELVIPGPAQCSLFLLESGETNQERVERCSLTGSEG